MMNKIPVLILGAGGVGSALLRQIVLARGRVAARNELHFMVVAVADSKSWWWEPAGLQDEQLLDIVNAREGGLPVAPQHRAEPLPDRKRPSDRRLIDILHNAGLRNTILVDVTAAAGMEPVLAHALELGFGAVLANKKPFSGPYPTARPFFNHPRVRHESTVGGGQPVIAALRYLLDVNDPITAIAGQLSGTMGYICQQLDEGVPLSAAVRAARARGFTEPDPRDDLGGMDVMRKVMILGRMAGWPLEVADISVESLYTPELADLSVPDFLEAARVLDDSLRKRVQRAAAQGHVLRYVAELTAAGGSVGLTAVPAGSPLASMKYISFRTGNYDDEPLLIAGKGAGVEMTAAGVLGDMIDLAREWN